MTPISDDQIAALVDAADKYRQTYVLDCESCDHEPTEFESVMIEDFTNGLLSDEGFLAPIRALASRVQSDVAVIAGLREEVERFKSENLRLRLALTQAKHRARDVQDIADAALSPPPVLGGAE